MILPDINLLIYAHNSSDANFKAANKWLDEQLNGSEITCFCWETINGFLRISTNPSAMKSPLSLRQAFTLVEFWLESPNAVLLRRTSRHLDVLKSVADSGNAHGKNFSDAVLAAVAVEHNATLATTDADFQKYDKLKFINPLTAN
jgi:uncharacterized protein